MAEFSSYTIEPRFTADLAGRYEVPPVDSPGSGSALFRQVGRNRVFYALDVTGLQDITEAHIHKGRAGRNGPVVAWLFGPSPGRTVSGLLARGTLQSSDLVGPLRGRRISSLVNLMRSGQAYVNVHTRQYPEGEIRGQIRMAGRSAVSTSTDWWQYGGMS